MKGAISCGEYYRKGNCLAGKPIVDAFELGESLEVAGCVLTEDAWDELEGAVTKGTDQLADFTRQMTFQYQTPCKSDKSRSLRMVSFPFSGSEDSIRGKVEGAFTAHKKEISEKVKNKFENTIAMLECIEQL